MNNEQELFAAATKHDVANAVKHLRNWMSYIDNHNRHNYADLIEAQAKLIAWLLAQRDANPAALRAPVIVTEVTAVVALGWLHEIIEPDGRSAKMYSASPNNPWGQWVKQYADQCKYKCTTLYALSTPETAGQP